MFSGQIEFEPVRLAPVGQSRLSQSQPLNCHIDDSLSLRPLETEDADPLFTLIDTNRAYLRQWLPWLDNNQTIEDSRAFIRDRHEQANSNHGFVLALCYDTQLVGVIGLNDISWENRLSGIGYWLAASYQGKGIVTRACKALLDYGFTDLDLNRIDIRCAPKNLRSQRVAKRLGLIYEGTLREAEWLYDHFVDHQIYSMLQREWPQKQQS